MEYKTTAGTTKDIDIQKRVVTGYLSTFGNLDRDNDTMSKGAFKKTIEERKGNIFFLNQHNWQQPLSKFAILSEDEKGLYFESDVLPDTSYSNDVLKLYEAGVLDQHSIGFQTLKADNDTKSKTRNIKEVKLYEGSVVTMAANPSARFTGLKSMTIEDINDKERKLISAIKNGTFTDETFVLLEIALKELSLQSYELGKKSLEAAEVSTYEPMTEIKNELLNFKL